MTKLIEITVDEQRMMTHLIKLSQWHRETSRISEMSENHPYVLESCNVWSEKRVEKTNQWRTASGTVIDNVGGVFIHRNNIIWNVGTMIQK